MKHWLLAVALVCFGSTANAQLYPIGRSFGSSGQFQFALDKLPAIGGCVLDERMDAQFLGGPCLDPLDMLVHGEPALTLGGAVLYNAEHGNPTYNIQVGFVAGTIAKNTITSIAEKIPVFESLTSIELPKFWTEVSKRTRFLLSAGPRPIHTKDVHSNFTAGFGFRIDGTDALITAGQLIQKGLGYGPDGSITKDTSSYLPPKLALYRGRLNENSI